MKPGLPQYIEPLRLAESGETISGSLRVDGLRRLGRLLVEPHGVVEFRLEFGKDELGMIHVTGGYSTELTVLCQRCLEPMVLKIAQPIDVEMAADALAAERLREDDGPMALAEGQVHLASFIEDELLLGMPMVPRHEAAQCPKAAELEAQSARRNPFAVLKDYHPEKS